MHIRDFSMIRGGGSTAIIVCVSSQIVVDEAGLLARLRSIRKRFATPVTIVTVDPSVLGVRAVRAFLQSELECQFVFSGDQDYVFVDALAHAKRLATKSALLVSYDSFVGDFPEILKLLAECERSNSTYVLNCRVQAIYFTVECVRHLTIDLMCISDRAAFVEIASALTGAPLNIGASSSRNETPRHLFVTRELLKRLGGIERLRALPIRFGAYGVQEFDITWEVANDEVGDCYEFGSLCHTLAGVDVNHERKRSQVYDITPAPWKGGNEAQQSDEVIQLPRQVLTVRWIDEALVEHDASTPAVFIVSNYNKAEYIAASLYSLLSQTRENISVEVIDDLSDDKSLENAKAFVELLDPTGRYVRLHRNTVNRGTYWIRNCVLSSLPDIDLSTYFINDSDDYSSAQRAYLQLAMLGGLSANFGDIVRVDSSYSPLPLNGQVERYGTASLACRSRVHAEIGFYQNVRKNADTEFIERIKRFVGENAVRWFRYPLLFQPFDGLNLTADIYTLGTRGAQLQQSLGNRAAHMEAFRKHHGRLKKENVASHFTFPLSSMPREYASLGTDFLVRGYEGFDSCMLVFFEAVDVELKKKLITTGFSVATLVSSSAWRIERSGFPDFVCDLSFDAALSHFVDQTGFYGYIVAADALPCPASELKSPRDLLTNRLAQTVYLSKASGDKTVFRISGSVGPKYDCSAISSAESFAVLSRGTFFHSSAVSTEA